MKVYSSLRSKKVRDKDCKIVRRKGRVYVINKKNHIYYILKIIMIIMIWNIGKELLMIRFLKHKMIYKIRT